MKKQKTIVEGVIKRMIEETIDQEKRGWPPGCAGFYYQPLRPKILGGFKEDRHNSSKTR